jgi:catechol 2,3-dioxygenase-like lactoylglutathione lyase family enzyme
MTIGMTLDCVDIAAAARFWSVALGFEEPLPLDGAAQFHALVSPGTGLHHLTLQRVAEPKLVKNRAHLDLFVDDLESEVARLHAIGAETLAVHDDEGGFRTATMADPLGNEFCVVQR